ncbi:MAG: DUF192 domain-containing protein [Campylobacteraceae bacterium]|jgi:uncharacterized membrane protein (UPF0127 family)|nr:DUF192 domain-containing protein [Campylobacteraceae bacterium]
MRICLSVLLFCGAIFADTLCDISFDNGLKLPSVPLADTDEKRRKGLSNRDDVGNGMLFSWREPTSVGFWMKDTKVALDIGFFGKDKKLFQIDRMEPLSLDSHPSDKPILLALELKRSGFSDNNLTVGVKVTALNCQ